MSMFNFRIIPAPNGVDVIDKTLKTPYKALTPVQMMEYIETERRLYAMEQAAKRTAREAERKRKMARNPFYRIACVLGII